ncbi:MAG: hypothetical protein A2150_07895 [Candidatus Muproteobacteria bacterium RBG_16_64_11]|uniref:Glycerophosphoryl diester phosphodiesterase membrane domain-containing protein n=1 Tax=Candidatus Muproteobacteria bacterium RBG_16_64_11 TaxID=1817758 RepID=A0A1F6TBB8_9PROT|nr:MAG: hypothetical protein A2150_07895 [Candidatus Muproteobacteria bacterium RBG_16_64_11]
MTQVNTFDAVRGWEWLRAGLRLFGKAPALWLAIALLYLAIGFLFNLLPFVGRLVMVLLTPLFTAGAFAAAAETDQAPPAGPLFGPGETPAARAGTLWGLLKQAAARLFAGFNDLDRALPAMIVGALALGGVVIIQILVQVLKVGTHTVSVLFGGAVSVTALLPSLLGLIAMVAIELAFAMALVYAIPLIVFQNETPLAALRRSFFASLVNARPLMLFGGVFLLGFIAVQWLFGLVGSLGYVGYFALGAALLPVLVTGVYSSYRDLHAAP